MKFQFLLFFGCLFTATLLGQVPAPSAIDAIFSDWNQPEVPGGALGIVQNGELVYATGYGSADLEHDIPITPQTVFYIGSVSKQFVTFCILLLEEEGKIDLDAPVQTYLPDFPEYDAPLTIRNFIHHTSGVRDYLTLWQLKGRNYLDEMEPTEVYNLIKRQRKLNFAPGERYLYSNSCYFMLAMIVEKVSGQSIREFAQERIFGPLGMTQTRFYDDNTKLIKNRAFSYSRTANGFDNLIMRFDLVGSGGVYSSIADLYKWDQNFYQNQLGKGGQAIIDRMHEEGLLNNGESTGYAFALWNGEHNGLRTVSHGGSLAGYRAQLLRFPDQQFSVIILGNRSDADPTDKAYQVADLFLASSYSTPATPKVEEASPPTVKAVSTAPFQPTSEDLAAYRGTFYSPELDETCRFFVENGILMADVGLPVMVPMRPVAPDRFEFASEGILCRFQRTNGTVIGFELDAGRVQQLAFERQ